MTLSAGFSASMEKPASQKFFISLICHAEYGVPRDAPEVGAETVFREWVPRLTRTLDEFEKSTGKRVPVTWCCGAYHDRESIESGKILCSDHFPDVWKALHERGDEIGLHSHAPETGASRFANAMNHDLYVREDVERMVDAGFDPPKTYVPHMMLWRDELAKTLIDSGFEASSTVIALPGKYLGWVDLFEAVGISMQQYLLSEHRPTAYPFRPYRVSREGMAKTGESELVELPVIGYLGKWDHPDFESSPPYDLLVDVKDLAPRNGIAERYAAFERETGRPYPSLRQRWRARKETAVDIWPTLFHPFEMNSERIKRLEKLLWEVASWDDVEFATALDASRVWKAEHRTIAKDARLSTKLTNCTNNICEEML